MYKAAIFDLDGTLLNTIKDLAAACNTALEAFDYPTHDEETYKTYVGNGIYKLVERSVPEEKRDKANVLKVKEVFDAYYSEHSLDQTQPYEGIRELLKTLKENGIVCGVVTNKAHSYAVKLVELFFGDLVEYTLGQREGIPTKPHPQSVLEMIDYFKVSQQECLYIGDSNVDMETAKAADVDSVGVLWGFRGEEELVKAGAKYIISTTRELEMILLGE